MRPHSWVLPGLYSSGRWQGVQWNGQQSGRVRLRARTWHVRGLGESFCKWSGHNIKSPYRLTSRGRMRGAGATCTAPTTNGRPKRMKVPEYGKIARESQSPPFRQSGDSRLAATCRSGFREQIDGIGWPRATLYIDTQDTRDGFRGPVGLQAPVFRKESEGGIPRRVRRQPGGESGQH